MLALVVIDRSITRRTGDPLVFHMPIVGWRAGGPRSWARLTTIAITTCQIGTLVHDLKGMKHVPLRLALEPVLPARAPAPGDRTLGGGYRVRLAGGPALLDDDPLLDAYGAVIDWVSVEDEEAAQADSFAPGRTLTLSAEPPAEWGCDEAGVRDADDIRQAGTLSGPSGAMACAALDRGLPVAAIVLWETRTVIDDRRAGLKVLVHSPALVRVESPPPLAPRPQRGTRRRLVLHAGANDDLRWWDSSAAGGPIDVADLPVSEDLADAFEALRRGYAGLAQRAVAGSDDGFDRLESSWTRDALEGEARQLWARARQELGRRYVVGFYSPDMAEPIWTPTDDEDDDDVSF